MFVWSVVAWYMVVLWSVMRLTQDWAWLGWTAAVGRWGAAPPDSETAPWWSLSATTFPALSVVVSQRREQKGERVFYLPFLAAWA